MIDDFDLMLEDLARIRGKLSDRVDLECMDYMIWLVRKLQSVDAMIEMNACGGRYDA